MRERIIVAHHTPNVDVTGPVEVVRDWTDEEPTALSVGGIDIFDWLVWASANDLNVRVTLYVIPE